MPDGEHSVLDSSIIMYGSNMGNSNQHDHYLLPTALFGGRIRQPASSRPSTRPWPMCT